jgi:hypothetical protein
LILGQRVPFYSALVCLNKLLLNSRWRFWWDWGQGIERCACRWMNNVKQLPLAASALINTSATSGLIHKHSWELRVRVVFT